MNTIKQKFKNMAFKIKIFLFFYILKIKNSLSKLFHPAYISTTNFLSQL